MKILINGLITGLTIGVILTGCIGGGGLKSLSRPNAVAVASDGSLWIMDRGNYRVVHLSQDGHFLGTFGELGIGKEEIYRGWDIGIDAQGDIAFLNLIPRDEMADAIGNYSIKVFSPQGKYLYTVGEQKYGEGELGYVPYGMDIDAQGRFYMADVGSNTLRIFDKEGKQLANLWGKGNPIDGENELMSLDDVAYDDTRGLVYLLDSFLMQVFQLKLTYTPAGEPQVEYINTFGGYGREAGKLSYPQKLSVDDGTGRVYVGDMGNQRIKVFDDKCTFLYEMNVSGVDTWQVMGVSLAPDGTLYAADSFNNVIWVFPPGEKTGTRLEVK